MRGYISIVKVSNYCYMLYVAHTYAQTGTEMPLHMNLCTIEVHMLFAYTRHHSARYARSIYIFSVHEKEIKYSLHYSIFFIY